MEQPSTNKVFADQLTLCSFRKASFGDLRPGVSAITTERGMIRYPHPGPPHNSVSGDVDHVPTVPEGLHGLDGLAQCTFLDGIRGYDTYADHIVSRYGPQLESYVFEGIRRLGDTKLDDKGVYSPCGVGVSTGSSHRNGLGLISSDSPDKHVSRKSMFVWNPEIQMAWFYCKETSGKRGKVGVLMPQGHRMTFVPLENVGGSSEHLMAWCEQVRRLVSPKSVKYVASTQSIGLTQKSIFSFDDCVREIGLPPNWESAVRAAGILKR